MARGGYRQPTNPAPVSGPGSLSKRTDGGPSNPLPTQRIPNMPWGQGEEFRTTQVSGNEAIRSIEQTNTPNAGFMNSASSQPIISLNAPTQMPNIPVTDGVDVGLGRDSSALGLLDQERLANDQYRAQIAMYLPALLKIAARPDVSNVTRTIIRKLRDEI